MDATPDLHFVLSKQRERLTWHDCLAELIDNSFDAGASRAVLEWRDNRFSIEDDGRGIADISAVVKLGSHRKQSTTRLGKYGVGIKDAWAWISDRMSIRTTRDGMTTTLDVAMSEFEQIDGRWVCNDPEERPALPGEIGTKITFGPMWQNRKTAQQDTFDRLSITFMPALAAGKQIVRVIKGKRQPLIPHRMPAMQESIEETFEVAGLAVSLLAGIAQEGERIQCPGFLVSFGHRVVKVSDIGTKHYNADRVVGRIALGHGWALTPHKNDFAEHSEELEEAIYRRIERLLIKSDQMSDIVESNTIRAELEDMVNACIKEATVKEKRPGSGQRQIGTALPAQTGRKRRKAAVVDETQPGSVEKVQSRRRGFQIKWAHLGDVLLGVCYPETKTVQLNIENRFIAAMKEQKNRPALVSIAVGLLCHAEDMLDGLQKRVVPKGEFAESWGTVMSTLEDKGAVNANAD